MADYYHYRQKIEKQRRRRNAVVALMVVLIILCAAAGFFWMSRHNQQANTPQAEPAMPTAETAATATPEQPEPTAQTPGNPQRLLPAVDNAAWDTATPVEQTIDLEYLNTDSRMAALPALAPWSAATLTPLLFWATALPRAWSVTPPATRTPMCAPTVRRSGKCCL